MSTLQAENAAEQICIRAYDAADATQAAAVWNEIVREGNAFPQETELRDAEAHAFFAEQSFTGIACPPRERETVLGLYILHPNNIGRCGHLANASYAVAACLRGRRIGERLVLHSIDKAQELGFSVLQFNAVVAENTAALALYKKLGFIQLGRIPGGFRLPDGSYTDIIPHYICTDSARD